MRMLIVLFAVLSGSNPALKLVQQDRELSAAIRGYNRAHQEWADAVNSWGKRQLQNRQQFGSAVLDARQVQAEGRIKEAGAKLVEQAERLCKATRQIVKASARLGGRQ